MVKTVEEFLKVMDEHIKLKEEIYGDSWKKESFEFLEKRIKNKLEEFQLTKHPDKLISLANLTMLLHLKMENEKQWV